MRSSGRLVSFFCIVFVVHGGIDEDEEKLPSKCHVCKHLVREMMDELDRSGKSREVFSTGQLFQQERKKIDYKTSEIRLTEALENACSNVLDYKVHKDKPLALRYEKVESVTFKTLKGLKNKGVKVDLGFPDDMWDTPDAEVTRLKNRCEFMVETYEEELEDWYWNHQSKNLTDWLCIKRVLGPEQVDCLNETIPEKKDDQVKGEGVKKEGDRKESDSDKIRRLVRKQAEEQSESNDNKRVVAEKSEGKTDERKGTTTSAQYKEKKKYKDDDEKANGEESDSDKIQRLIREQAEEQAKGHKNKRELGEKNKAKPDKRKKAKTPSKNKGKKEKSKDKNSDEYTKKQKRFMDETDPDKIERLIREQAESQARRGERNRRSFGGMEEGKRERLKRRLRDIDDPLRMRREIRKIRLKELDEDDYLPTEPWEDDMDSVPDDVRRDLRRRHYERMDDLEELQHELRTRAFEHDDFDDPDEFHLRELRHQFVEEAEDVRDPKELRKRIQDLDALSAIFARPGRRGRGHRNWRDEL